MPTLITSKFSKWELSERESLEGQLLTFNQKCVIQNHIADLAKEKIELTYSLNDSPTYWQREAELQGQIGILEMLLNAADNAVLELEAYMQSTGNSVDIDTITGNSTSPFAGATYSNSPSTSDSN